MTRTETIHFSNREYHRELESDLPTYEVNYRSAGAAFRDKLLKRAKALVDRVLTTDLCRGEFIDENAVGWFTRWVRYRQKLDALKHELYTYSHHLVALQRHAAIANDRQSYWQEECLFSACGNAIHYISEIQEEIL